MPTYDVETEIRRRVNDSMTAPRTPHPQRQVRRRTAVADRLRRLADRLDA
ncbi:hypothetical protein [Nocardioides limicola]|nr:hypothetical protein [Nocardioides sp. DJM-14]